MPKTITFTANLLAETTYTFRSWAEGKAARAESESFQVGGKGINVSKMLNRLEAENQALCFPGGPFGPACAAWLAEKGIATLAFPEGCVTRAGTVVRASGREETTFLGVDSIVSEQAIREAVAVLRGMEGRWVFAVCGSVQGWKEARWEPLRQWVAERGENVSLVVDNYGPSLPWFAEQGPELIKFNRDELELLYPERERAETTERLLRRARERFACRRWVVTNGGNPIWVMDGEGDPVRFNPPHVEAVSPTGCGDVFFATMIDCLYNQSGYTLLDAAKRAADYASRSAAMPGIAEFAL